MKPQFDKDILINASKLRMIELGKTSASYSKLLRAVVPKLVGYDPSEILKESHSFLKGVAQKKVLHGSTVMTVSQ